jgi:hypothetical protein
MADTDQGEDKKGGRWESNQEHERGGYTEQMKIGATRKVDL